MLGAWPTCQVVPKSETNMIEVTRREVVMQKKVGNFSFLMPGRMRKKLKKIVTMNT